MHQAFVAGEVIVPLVLPEPQLHECGQCRPEAGSLDMHAAASPTGMELLSAAG